MDNPALAITLGTGDAADGRRRGTVGLSGGGLVEAGFWNRHVNTVLSRKSQLKLPRLPTLEFIDFLPEGNPDRPGGTAGGANPQLMIGN